MASCPLSGELSTRLVQTIPVDSLARYWRFIGGTDVRALYAGIDRLELREGAEGLLFYHPLVPGDAAFYRHCYRSFGFKPTLAQIRPECRLAAGFVADGARVLDVGCGFGGFGRCLPRARYVGIDLSFDASDLDPRHAPLDIRRQSLDEHAAEAPEPYDVVSAFHVLEHVADPRGFFAALAGLARPGGLVIVAVPKFPSPMTEIPAFPINMPPHHLTFWTRAALARLAGQAGLGLLHLDTVSHGAAEDVIFWMRRFSLAVSDKDMARLDRYAIGSLLLAAAAGRTVARLRSWRERPGEAPNYLLVARKP